MVLSEHAAAQPAASRLPSMSLVFGCEPAQVARVRAIVSAALVNCPRRDDVVLVAGELAVNAIVHSTRRLGGTFTVQLYKAPRAVALWVHDADGDGAPVLTSEPPSPIDAPDLPAEELEHGRGLRLVDACADRWDHRTGGDGCAVWATFTLPGAATGTEPSSDFPSPGDIRALTAVPRSVLPGLNDS